MSFFGQSEQFEKLHAKIDQTLELVAANARRIDKLASDQARTNQRIADHHTHRKRCAQRIEAVEVALSERTAAQASTQQQITEQISELQTNATETHTALSERITALTSDVQTLKLETYANADAIASAAADADASAPQAEQFRELTQQLAELTEQLAALQADHVTKQQLDNATNALTEAHTALSHEITKRLPQSAGKQLSDLCNVAEVKAAEALQIAQTSRDSMLKALQTVDKQKALTAEHAGQITELQKQCRDLKSQCNGYATQQQQQHKTIDALGNTLQATQASIDAHKAETADAIDNLSFTLAEPVIGRIKALEAASTTKTETHTALQSQISELRTNHNALDADVTRLHAHLGALAPIERVDAHSEQLEQLEQQLEHKLGEHIANTQAATQALTADIADLQTEIDASPTLEQHASLASRISELESIAEQANRLAQQIGEQYRIDAGHISSAVNAAQSMQQQVDNALSRLDTIATSIVTETDDRKAETQVTREQLGNAIDALNAAQQALSQQVQANSQVLRNVPRADALAAANDIAEQLHKSLSELQTEVQRISDATESNRQLLKDMQATVHSLMH